ncbi:MAG TPA: hypothetical protein VFT29_08755 [Gemmatimonadaceae bacterium]|nr:hypothetical protein [Gemmatimonadaceae bacterium]
MSSSRRSPRFVVAVFLMLSPMVVAIGQSSVAISPFVSYVPSAATNPLAGMALTFGGTTGLALRGSADLSVSNPEKTATTTGEANGGYRPWAADADAMLFLGGLGGGATVFSRSLAPYVFAGIGMTGGDSSGVNLVAHNWSYGVGTSIPLGFDADLFGEARWRMSKYVLPTSEGAPDSRSELRFGLSFHVGGSREAAPEPRRRGRRMDVYDDDVAQAAVVPQTPVIVQQPTPVIVQQPAPVVVASEPDVQMIPQRTTEINVNMPGTVVRRQPRRYETVTRTTVTTARVLSRSRAGIVYRPRVASSRSERVTSSTTSSARASKRESSTAKTSRQMTCTSSGCKRVGTRERQP